MSRQDDIKKLITNHQRRLQKLKELQALQGLSVDPKVLLEIEDIETEIKSLQIELKELENKAGLRGVETSTISKIGRGSLIWLWVGVGVFILAVVSVSTNFFVRRYEKKIAPSSTIGMATTSIPTITLIPATYTPIFIVETPMETYVPPTKSSDGKNYVLVARVGDPYFDAANIGAQEAAKKLGVTVTYQGSSTTDASQQIQLLNALIVQKVDGLAVSAYDTDALAPTGKAAIAAGLPVISWDTAIAPEGRLLHVNQATTEGIGRGQIQLAAKLAGGEGQIAILSATSTSPNQNEWIKWMKEELKKPEYAKIELVTIVYGDDEDKKSFIEAQGLLNTYDNLKVIIAPATIGIVASARAVQFSDKIGKVMVTGLGTPNQLRSYVQSGIIPAFQLWNVVDLGYLSIYALDAIATGKIKGQPGDKFTAGKLGEYTVDENSEVLLGSPFTFDINNIDKFNF